MGPIDLSTPVWRKSSYSNSDGGACVEAAANWRKSSYSNPDGGQCVEAADNLPGIVPVRDSKNPQGPVLTFPTTAFTSFIQAVRTAALTP
ncbi:DUF397 domain-containing protein [Streptomyces sp. NRRL F-5135]|uniref:DUF397 domain-containing protein n=1 Tax=Streptomyces sp. NRRL F-5135 TaxID=1463858 RepID=UPI0004C9F7B8|nr:DUF397 domain-containing protein [Streptomyces sp. NRRL F-5135]